MRWRSALALGLLCMSAGPTSAQDLLQRIFDAHPERYAKVLGEREARRVQVRLTEVGTPEDPKALVAHNYRVGAEYLYPASALKPAAAIAAILKVQGLAGPSAPPIGLKKRIRISPRTEEAPDQVTSLAAAMRKTLIVSSNRAYNALYEIAGQCFLNQVMWDAGLKDIRLNHRLSLILSVDENRETPAWRTRQGGRALTHPSERCDADLDNKASKRLLVGRAYIEDGVRIEEPMNFTSKNHMGIEALHGLLLLLVRPDADHGLTPFPLKAPHREALLNALRTLPHESKWPRWTHKKFDPYRFKPFLRGLERVRPLDSLRVTSKAGKAYGFRIENAYIEDLKSGRAFLLTAGLHVDMDGTLNDNRYDYALADTFLANLAEDVARALLDAPERSSR